ncbi:MAG: adenine phosphoribosyltransferase [Planctomycetota bacterium]
MAPTPLDLGALVRTVPDFPQPGIAFRDITPLLAHPGALAQVVEHWTARFGSAGVERVVAIESRGFLFGAPLAVALGAGVVPVRKPGKLPATTLGEDYALEYGTGRLEMHADAVTPGQRVLLVDDVLATGGTLAAAAALARRAGANVIGAAVLIELGGLGGRARLGDVPVDSLLELAA